MLDQYDGYIACKVNQNDGNFAMCDVTGAVSTRPAVSVDDEHWIGPNGVRIYKERLGMNSAEFLDAYPVRKKCTMRLVVAVASNPDAGHEAAAQSSAPYGQ